MAAVNRRPSQHLSRHSVAMDDDVSPCAPPAIFYALSSAAEDANQASDIGSVLRIDQE